MDNKTIVFIDDNPVNLDDFKLAAEEFAVEVPDIDLTNDLDSLVQRIIEINPDAVVVDFELSGMRTDIKYDGTEILKLLEEKTYNLPKFIFTSYHVEADAAASDINIVYDKENYKQRELIQRIIKQIGKYRERLQLYQEELVILLQEQQKRKLTYKEEEKIIELDSILEKTLNKPTAVPESLKTTSVMTKLDEISNIMDFLVEELKNNDI